MLESMNEMRRLGGEDWFQLGDRDLAVHVLRREALRRGTPLSTVTQALAARLGVRHPILPMSDTPVRTRVRTASGELDFQDYFVKRRCRPRVTGFRFTGSRAAHIPAALQRLTRPEKVQAVVLCPSNPFVSIAPIYSVPAIRKWLAARTFPVIAVSPIIGGAAVKGPAAKMMRELGMNATTLDIVRHYGNKVDRWVIDRQDAEVAATISGWGKQVTVTDTLMSNPHKSARLARQVVKLAQRPAKR